jgi:cyanate permease
MIGGALGPLLTGYIFDMTNSYQMAFLLCAAVSMAGILLSVLLKAKKS